MSSIEVNAMPAGDILVVDDVVDNLKLLIDILARAGYHARPAGDGELALRSVQARQPALILLDIMMPEMDGYEVCRRLKADALTRDVPVIFLSGLAETTDKSEGFALGAVDYITKPFHGEEVLARVRAHLALAAAKEQLKAQNLQLQQANERLTGEIAERTRAQEALRESRDRLDALNLSVGNGIISVNEQQHIALFNTAAEHMFERTAAAAIGQPLSMLLPERFRMPHENHVRLFGASGQSNRTMGTYGLIYGLRASGEEFPIEATVSQEGKSPGKLFTVILRDITMRRQAEQLREHLMRQLELLSERLATAQEQERRKLAHDLHEDVGQQLVALKFYLQMMGPASGATQTKTPRDEALSVTAHAVERVRELVTDLEPLELNDFGPSAALRTYCLQQAEAGAWNLHIDAPNTDIRAPRTVEQACFRVLQEGLNNILYHATASEVWVGLHHDSGQLELVIRDNGIGFEYNADSVDDGRGGGNLGLFEMQIRAKQVGGSVQIKSAPGGGTEIRAVFPLVAAPS